MSALGHSRPGPAGRRCSHVRCAPKAAVGHQNAIGRDGPKADMAARVECTFRGNSHLTKVVRVARRDQNAALQKPRGHLKNAL